jgi:FkbM family methyltransferase
MLGQTLRYVDPMANVVDVGAAVGMYSATWSPLCRRVYSYEAVPAVFTQLQKTALNHPNMMVINKAVSDFVGTSEFWVDTKRLSNSSFRKLLDSSQKIEVETTKLDVEDVGEVCLLKVDVEGNELDVLKGAEMLIEKQKPILMVEIYPPFNNGPVADTFKHLFDRGYSAHYNLVGQGLFPLKNLEHAVSVAEDQKMWRLTDADFLFTHNA